MVQDHAWTFFLSFHYSLRASCFFFPWQKASWRSLSALQWKAAALESYHVKNKQQMLRLNHLKTEGISTSWCKNLQKSCIFIFAVRDLQSYFQDRIYCMLMFICRFLSLLMYLLASMQSLETNQINDVMQGTTHKNKLNCSDALILYL